MLDVVFGQCSIHHCLPFDLDLPTRCETAAHVVIKSDVPRKRCPQGAKDLNLEHRRVRFSPIHGAGAGLRDTRASHTSVPPQLPDQQNPTLAGGVAPRLLRGGFPRSPGRPGRGTVTSIMSDPKTAYATASGRGTECSEFGEPRRKDSFGKWSC